MSEILRRLPLAGIGTSPVVVSFRFLIFRLNLKWCLLVVLVMLKDTIEEDQGSLMHHSVGDMITMT